MLVADLALASWIIWFVWMAFGAAFEVFTVLEEKRTGALPLTRVVRDRLMRRSTVVKLGVLLFLTWIWVHFITTLDW